MPRKSKHDWLKSPVAKKTKQTKLTAPTCGGGDKLARGSAGSSATFPSLSHVTNKQYDLAFVSKKQFIKTYGQDAYDRAISGDFS